MKLLRYLSGLIAITCLLLLVACSDSFKGSTDQVGLVNTPSFMSQYCSGCHEPALPGQHEAGEWPTVIARMEYHRERRGLHKIPTQDIEKIIGYLSGKEAHQ